LHYKIHSKEQEFVLNTLPRFDVSHTVKSHKLINNSMNDTFLKNYEMFP